MRLNLRPWGGVSRLLGQPWAEPETGQWQPTTSVHDPNPPITLEDPGTGAFFADAYFSGTVPRSGSLTADAVLEEAPTPPAPPATEFTADAVILGAAYDFEDDFNRVEASDFGAASSDGHAYTDFSGGGTGTTSVDGSQLVVDNTGSFYYRGVFVTDLPVFSGAEISFDFYVGADPTEYVQYGLFRPELDIYIEQDSGADWVLEFQWISQSFTPTASTWYTAKVVYGDGPTGGSASKVWERGDPEPGWQVLDTHADVLDVQPTGELNIFVENDGTDLAQLDNLRIRRTGSIPQSGSFTANAVIQRTIGDGTTTVPEFIGSSTATTSSSALWLIAPSAMAVDDLLVVTMRAGSLFTPAGWAIGTSTVSYESTRLFVLTRLATAGDVANGHVQIPVTASSGFPADAHLSVWRNASGFAHHFVNTSFGAASTATDGWVGVAPTVISITWATRNNSVSFPSYSISSEPSGMTQVEFDRGMASYIEEFPVQGQLGTKTLTWSGYASSSGVSQVHIANGGRIFTADAYFIPASGQETFEDDFTADAWITRTQSASFAVNAYIVRGGRTVHSSDLHFGEMDDLAIVLSAALGPVTQGSTLHDALVELESRISAREASGS